MKKAGKLIGVAIGVLLLLCCQEVLSFSILWKLLVPAAIVLIGLKLVFTGFFGNKANKMLAQVKKNGGKTGSGCAVFSGSERNYNGEVFESAELTAVFGGVECDLRYSYTTKTHPVNNRRMRLLLSVFCITRASEYPPPVPSSPAGTDIRRSCHNLLQKSCGNFQKICYNFYREKMYDGGT